jgi:hypothetical protein
MPQLNDPAALESAVRQTVSGVTVSDIHTHLFPPSHGKMLLWGIDELLVFHYLVAELFTVAPRGLTYKKFWVLPKTALRVDIFVVDRPSAAKVLKAAGYKTVAFARARKCGHLHVEGCWWFCNNPSIVEEMPGKRSSPSEIRLAKRRRKRRTQAPQKKPPKWPRRLAEALLVTLTVSRLVWVGKKVVDLVVGCFR